MSVSVEKVKDQEQQSYHAQLCQELARPTFGRVAPVLDGKQQTIEDDTA
jgi:hypothetical protein